eukprot:GHVS01065480.1.p1 GENE.GHVS01065480.1~~GHVS01065480.1.p1  ORF type:complete len:326 (+),score=33.45 GHVS01065480.1:147-1124(+)
MSLIRFPTTAADLKLRAALSLVKRLPPTEIQNTIESLSRLAPEEAESVSSNINSELDVLYDTTASRHFIGCRFNRDVGGVYYRSPWSNRYFSSTTTSPPLTAPTKLSDHLRKLEVEYNDVFDDYRHCYYDTGVSSVYLWDLPGSEGFAAAFCISHAVELDCAKSSWSSVHVFDVLQKSGEAYSAGGLTVNYRLRSKVLFSSSLPTFPLSTANASSSNWATLTSHICKTSEFSKKIEETVGLPSTSADQSLKGPSHICAIGRMIEDVEICARRQLEDIYMIKPIEVKKDVLWCTCVYIYRCTYSVICLRKCKYIFVLDSLLYVGFG